MKLATIMFWSRYSVGSAVLLINSLCRAGEQPANFVLFQRTVNELKERSIVLLSILFISLILPP